MAEQGDLARALQIAVSQIQPGSGPTEPMNEQDRAWLNAVLGEMAAESEKSKDPDSAGGKKPSVRRGGISAVLRSLVELIGNEAKPHIVDSVKNELEHIAEDGELMDQADDSERRSAVAPLTVLLLLACPTEKKKQVPQVPTLSAMIAPLCSILAELSQNSPDCQSEAMKLIPNLLAVIKSDRDPQMKTKAVYALSAILRGNQNEAVGSYLVPKLQGEAEEKTGNNLQRTKNEDSTPPEGVIDVLVWLILSRNQAPSARRKATFLLNCLAEQRHDVRHTLSTRYEKDLAKLNEDEVDIKELIDDLLKRIHANVSNGGKEPLALAMRDFDRS